ncbi:Ion transport domain [Dillenia turbinata]|uniref:Ion transport domain n=1 Tax=Dillenia turbinata TaxID=194707 RepID=A0AAN8ZSE3_9MAGN
MVVSDSNSSSVRFRDDVDTVKYVVPAKSEALGKKGSPGKFFKTKVLSRVFSEDYVSTENKIFDPRGSIVNGWNKIFLVACLVSLFLDPLFFFLPGVSEELCVEVNLSLEIALTLVRSVVDAFYMTQIFMRFRTAFVAPSSRVFGRGELIIDSSKVSARYLKRDFWLDLLAALPVPQILVWTTIPNLRDPTSSAKFALCFIIILQYLLRLCLTFSLSSQIIETAGVVTETAWAGAAYNLMLSMLASHVFGSCWYLLAIEREEECWKNACNLRNMDCDTTYFGCSSASNPRRISWFESSNITSLCDPSSDFFQFGIYGDALTFGITSSHFFNKYFYCLWWGLRNLSSLGQNLVTSIYIGENCFAILIAILGLVFFTLLIGNMQTFLQSTTARIEEWRIKRYDTEQWMRHRQLPRDLRQKVRRYDQYKWHATRGVNEASILNGLPKDLRRDIKRHLCLDLVRGVPLFDQMDDMMLDAICERLRPSLCTQDTCLVREGDPVSEMVFIIRGHLESYTTHGGRTGFFNSCRIGPGDFCGEELLPWALDPRPSAILPISTRTVKAITEFEAFALGADDLKFIASQYRRLHSKKLRQTFRFHSHQWRTWAACFIQAAWFRHKRSKEAAELKAREKSLTSSSFDPPKEQNPTALSPRISSFRAYLAASNKRGRSIRNGADMDILSLQKPKEPEFSVEDR